MFALVIVLGQFGCNTTNHISDTTLANGWLVNSSFGFNGYRIELPPDYNVYNLQDDNEVPTHVGALATLIQKRYEAWPENENLDRYVLANNANLIVFELSKVTYMSGVFRGMPDLQKRRMMYDVLKDWHGFYSGEAYERTVHGRGERMYIQVSAAGNEHMIDYFFLPGKLNETYIFTGIAPKDKRELVVNAIERMIFSLDN